MTFYRLFRYFLFLFLLGSFVLYLGRASFSPFPALSEAFSKFDAYYLSLNRIEDKEGDAVKAERILRSEAGRAIQKEQDNLSRFLADEKTLPALNNLVLRGFDSVEALVRTHLIQDEAFKDLVITARGAILYRYENVPVNLALAIKKDIETPEGVFTVETVYDSAPFFQNITNSPYPFAVRLKEQTVYSKAVNTHSFDRIIPRLDIGALASGFGLVQQKGAELLYYYKPQDQYVTSPVFFFIEKLPPARKVNGQALLIAGLSLGLIFLFLADRFILLCFSNHNRQQQRRRQFPEISSPMNTDNNMEWLDKLVSADLLKDKEPSEPPLSGKPKETKAPEESPQKEGGHEE